MCVCVIALLTLPLALAPIELQRRIIDDAVGSSDKILMYWLVGIYAVVIILQQLSKYSYNFFQGKLSESVVRHLRERILEKVETEKELEDEEGTVLSMLSSEVEPIGTFAGQAFAQLVTEGGVLLLILGYMLYTEFWLATIAMIAFIPQAIATPIYQNRINEKSVKRLNYVRGVGDDAVAIGRGEPHQEKGVSKALSIFKNRIAIYRLKFTLKAILNLSDHFADLIVLGCGGLMVIMGETNIGIVVAFLSGLGKLRDPWRTLITYFRGVSDTQIKFEMIRKKLDL